MRQKYLFFPSFVIEYIIGKFVEQKMTYNKAVALLSGAGIENAETDAAILFEHFAGVARHTLPFRKNEEIESVELASALERRLAREPLQYILGEWEFCGLRFTLNSDCLCPRPDTELIVELALKDLPPWAHFCDIGTGSGAIAVSTVHYRKDTTAEAFDINENALSAAAHNAEINGVADRIKFTEGDALSSHFLEGKAFDAIISNPPYIPASDIATMHANVRDYEPHEALFVPDDDPLIFYRAIADNAQQMLVAGGVLAFEIYEQFGEQTCQMLRERGFREVKSVRDANLKERIVWCRK